jgi:hypothetical protein
VTDHGHVLLVVDQRGQSVGDHLMVFDDENADSRISSQLFGLQDSTLHRFSAPNTPQFRDVVLVHGFTEDSAADQQANDC